MQDGYTGFVDRSEWWWVTLVSLTLLVFIFTPFIILALLNPATSGWQFMGAMHDYSNSALDLARMREGSEGHLLLTFRFTPEDNTAALVHPLYALLGQLSRYMRQSPFVIYHTMRVFVGFFMYLTIYHLGASIWVKVRTRRIFFIVASIGAGFGWLAALVTGLHGNIIVPDLMSPQAFPIYAAAANVHFPLAIACLALLASVIVPILRPGTSLMPSTENNGVVVFITSLALAFIYPDALLPIGIAYILSILIYWGLQRRVSEQEWQWGLWILVPALPVITYYILTLFNNPFVASWVAQRDNNIPSPLFLLVSISIPLLIALPAFWRAIRRFEADGDRFMLLWLLAMILGMYLPIGLGQYLIIGLMLPVAYFATRSIEDFWFRFIKRRFRTALYMLSIPIIVISHVFWLYLPIYSVLQSWQAYNGMMLSQDYSTSFLRLENRLKKDAVILASPDVSLWIPSWLGARVVYGHALENYEPEEAQAAVVEWYRTEDANVCERIIQDYGIDYVYLGPRERRIGAGACVENLNFIASFGNVIIYATENAASTP